MKFLRYLLPIVVLSLGFAMTASADERDLNERDFEAVHEFLNSKRTMDLSEKSQNLTLGGDIRAEWRHFIEKINGSRVNEDRFGDPLSKNRFNSILNFYIDYVCDRAWGVAWVEFDNDAGVERNDLSCEIDPETCTGSGFCSDLCLKKAYMGYNVCCDGQSRFDIEVGRRPLWTIFDSRIQFLSRFDGILLKYSTTFDCMVDFYINGGAFVIDQRVNWAGYVVEVGFLNIADCGLDFKYSFINWPKNGTNHCFVRRPRGAEFRNSQWTLAYHFDPEMICMPTTIYGAVLYNHASRRRFPEVVENPIIDTNGLRLGLGWYVGFIIGEIRQEGDWAFDMNYQVVQAQAVSDCDLSGIGTGNFLDDNFPLNGIGNGNYRGWWFEFDYALTDNLLLQAELEFSKQDKRLRSDLGDRTRHSFSQFELEAIYAF